MVALTKVERGQISIIDGSTGLTVEYDSGKLPPGFPTEQWSRQFEWYKERWHWFLGNSLAQVVTGDTDGSGEEYFPLHINSLRSLVRKHAGMLFGEVPDTPEPLVKTVGQPVRPLNGDQPTDEDRKLAQLAQNVTNHVWQQSSGRAIQMEGGEFCQFLGGTVYKIQYTPESDDLIPIRIRLIRPDYVLPIWSNESEWELNGCHVIYTVTRDQALNDYGVDLGRDSEYGTYTESWTKTSVRVAIDGQVISRKLADGRAFDYDGENPFGFVPFIYIPHIREGARYGTSHVEDVAAILKEYNARVSDTGIGILRTIERNRYMTNVAQTPKMETVAGSNGLKMVNLGITTPGAKEGPGVTIETPPLMSDAMNHFNAMLWTQFMREGFLAPIVYGEDEGSQRSGMTLAFRMWPIVAHSRVERTYWTDGKNAIDGMILRMLTKLPKNIKEDLAQRGIVIPDDVLRRITLSQDWAPQIPRDREQLVNETVLLKQSNLRSPEEGIKALGDIRDVPAEIEKIQDNQRFESELSAQTKAETSITKPVADSGLKEIA